MREKKERVREMTKCQIDIQREGMIKTNREKRKSERKSVCERERYI